MIITSSFSTRITNNILDTFQEDRGVAHFWTRTPKQYTFSQACQYKQSRRLWQTIQKNKQIIHSRSSRLVNLFKLPTLCFTSLYERRKHQQGSLTTRRIYYLTNWPLRTLSVAPFRFRDADFRSEWVRSFLLFCTPLNDSLRWVLTRWPRRGVRPAQKM